jgi:hypothetical protein
MRSLNRVTRSEWLLAIAVLALSPVLPATQLSAFSADAASLLGDARAQSAQLEKDAMALKSYTTGKLGTLRLGHAALIERINQDISQAGKLSFQLQRARGAASPAQQDAIDRVDPLLKELASSINTVAMRIPRVSAVVQKPPYTDYLRANARLASDLARLIAGHVDYAEAKEKAEEINHQVELINFD